MTMEPGFWIDNRPHPRPRPSLVWHAVLGCADPHDKTIWTVCGVTVHFTPTEMTWDTGPHGPNDGGDICVACLEKIPGWAQFL